MPIDLENTYQPINDYAVIGDPHTVSLVGKNGSIDWCCWPQFDSAVVFCRLLDARRGGYFQICPDKQYTSSRSYVGATNVLATEFEAADGRVRLTDFMPARPRSSDKPGEHRPRHSILRLVEGLSGSVDLAIHFHPTFDYVRTPTSVSTCPGGATARCGDQSATLACAVPLDLESDGAGGLVGLLRVSAGERVWFATTIQAAGEPSFGDFDPAHADAELQDTLEYWESWAATCNYHGPYRDLVVRSALVLKLLTFEPSGALIAAPTTSLPEKIGGTRNWDYRFTWLRDSALILEALQLIGYHDEAKGFFDWLQSVWLRCHGDLRIMYTIDGSPSLAEELLEHLEGYRKSAPVRIGNAAVDQTQLDIYGEVLEAAHFAHRDAGPPSPELWAVLSGLADKAAERWQEADQGIWEVRGGPRHFLYSKLLCWVALDRAVRMARNHHLPADFERWQASADAIRDAIESQGYNKELGAFTQSLGDPVLDASALAIPMVGFIEATDPRVRSTIDKIRSELTSHGLAYRYRAADGLPGGEATFALCTFWLVDNLALAGKVDEARRLFEHVVSFANDVGLLAEEIDPESGELLGNFPQGFSHLALIRSALYIAKAEARGAEDKPTSRAERATEIESVSQATG